MQHCTGDEPVPASILANILIAPPLCENTNQTESSPGLQSNSDYTPPISNNMTHLVTNDNTEKQDEENSSEKPVAVLDGKDIGMMKGPMLKDSENPSTHSHHITIDSTCEAHNALDKFKGNYADSSSRTGSPSTSRRVDAQCPELETPSRTETSTPTTLRKGSHYGSSRSVKVIIINNRDIPNILKHCVLIQADEINSSLCRHQIDNFSRL